MMRRRACTGEFVACFGEASRSACDMFRRRPAAPATPAAGCARTAARRPTKHIGRARTEAAQSGGILMRRMLILGGFAAAVLTVSSAHADWHEFWHRVGVDFHRNNAWPEPFLSADRQVTREYFRIQ